MSATNSTTLLDPARQNESRAYQLTAAVIVCPIFAGIFTLLRLYSRLILARKYLWEDFFIFVALICSVLMSVTNGLAVLYGSGRHIETISEAEFINFEKDGIAITQLYSLTHFFLKLSILLQYLHLGVLRSDRLLCYGLIAILCTGYLVFIIMRMVRCIPFQAQWDPDIPGAHCSFNNTWFMFASQVWNMVMDGVILLIPLVILRHSTAPLSQRVLLGGVLALGGSACIISGLRLPTLYPSTTSTDPSWDKVPSAIYALIEINIGISCASVVTLRPLFYRLRQFFSTGTETDPAQPTSMMQAKHSGRLRRLASDDLLLMTGDTKQTDSEVHELELGEVGRHHASGNVSIAESRMVPVEDSTDLEGQTHESLPAKRE